MFKKLISTIFKTPKLDARFIIIGIDFAQHQLAEWILSEGGSLVAFIDDEPWNHKTKMLGTSLRYPSELVALATKHDADLIIQFTGSGPDLDQTVIQTLKDTNVKLLTLPSGSFNDAFKQDIFKALASS